MQCIHLYTWTNNNHDKHRRQAQTGKCVKCGKQMHVCLSFKTNGGDAASSLLKLTQTPLSKYPGEKHLHVYDKCGRGTRFDIRLDERNQPTPGEYPVHAIDQ